MTEPLVTAGVDLRGLPWMRLDTMRLLDSDLFALSTGEEFKAAVALWCKSWTQQPGGSLPSDDRILAHLSGAGTRWKKVKGMALRGWVECSDGRLYHPVVAEQAISAWEERIEYRREVEGANERKRRERAERASMFDALKRAGHDLPWNTSTATLRDMSQRLSRDAASEPVTPVTVTVTAKTGEGEGRDGIPTPERVERTDTTPSARSPAAEHAIALNRIGVRVTAHDPRLLDAVAAGVTSQHLIDLANTHPGKGAPYLIATAQGQLRDGASTPAGNANGTDRPRESLVDRNARRAADILGSAAAA